MDERAFSRLFSSLPPYDVSKKFEWKLVNSHAAASGEDIELKCLKKDIERREDKKAERNKKSLSSS